MNIDLEGCLDPWTEDRPHVQVGLMKWLGDDNLTTIGRTIWAQQDKVQLGKLVRLRETDGGWSGNWKIVWIGDKILNKPVREEDL